MNLGFVKVLLWLGAIAFLGGIGWSAYEHRQTRPDRQTRHVTPEDQARVFDQKAPPEEKLPELPYDPIRNVFHTMNWTGKEPPPPPRPDEIKPVDTTKKHVPVDRLLQVLFIQQDTTTPDRSIAVVKYVGQLATFQAREQVDGHVLKVGDVLPQQFDYWKLVSVDAADGLTFTCVRPEDFSPAPADEVVKPPVPISGDIPLLGGGVSEIREPFPELDEQERQQLFDTWPTATFKTGRNQYMVGTDDALHIETNYLDILSNEVRHRTARNRQTGQPEGIEILTVTAGSVLSDFGVVAGDVIKSVNGHPVNSVNEAITFAKNNAEYYEVWEVVVANAGKERTITVQTPPK
jgi:membrane-associated protease RseP (regulator of RpoE activity)